MRRTRRLFAALVLVSSFASPALAQSGEASSGRLSSADSALVGRILLAEDRRDANDPALASGAAHADPRVRRLARRAAARIADSLFAARDSFAAAPPPEWPEPAWRLRYRALTGRGADCAALRAALADSAWPVRLRAADLAGPACAGDSALVATLDSWIGSLPADVTRRRRGDVSWHAAAHALTALARLRPAAAAPAVRELAGHESGHLRRYAARAAATLSDTATLRRLVRDTDPNVAETAIEGLSRLTGRAEDTLFIAALASSHPQVVRAAATALADSSSATAAAASPASTAAHQAAEAALANWPAGRSDSERDVRLALHAAAGRPVATERPDRRAAEQPSSRAAEPPPRAVALALGAETRLRVTMAATSGGGSFVVRLRGDVAPLTAARILALANGGYYDGTTWHRVEPDFVIQGGSHGNNEYVGHPHYFRDELGTVPHVRGTVGMSTRGHDTGDAQWFVNLRDNLRLGTAYTVFAEVIAGMDVVDGVLEGDLIESIREIDTPARGTAP